MFEDLTAYLSSLERLAGLGPARLYCGHGPPVEDGASKLAEYIEHRTKRVAQVAAAVAAAAAPRTLAEITAAVYPGLAEHLVAPAANNALQVLEHLVATGSAVQADRDGTAVWGAPGAKM